MNEQRMLTLISLLLHDKTRERWTEEFLTLSYELVNSESALSPLQKLAAMLDLCMAHSEFDIKIVNWVRRAAGIN